MFTKKAGIFGWQCGKKTVKVLDDDGDVENGPNPNAEILEIIIPCAIYEDRTGKIELLMQNDELIIRQMPIKGRESVAGTIRIPMQVLEWLKHLDKQE